MLQKIIFHTFSNWKKLTKLEIDFHLITKNGNKICSKTHTVKRLKPMIINYSELNYFEYINHINQINKECKNNLSKLGNAILSEYQKKKRHTFNSGVLDSGDYIVKCSWELSPTFKRISYEEYKNWKEKK